MMHRLAQRPWLGQDCAQLDPVVETLGLTLPSLLFLIWYFRGRDESYSKPNSEPFSKPHSKPYSKPNS